MVFQGSSDQAIEQATRRFREAYTRASNFIHRRKAEPGFDRCGVMWGFSSATFWPTEEPRRPLSKLMVYGEAFHHVASGLLVDQARWAPRHHPRWIPAAGRLDLNTANF